MKTSMKSILFFLLVIPVSFLHAQDSIPEITLEKISLKIDLKPNSSYRFVSKNSHSFIQEIMGSEMETNQESIATYKYEVESNDGKVMKIKATCERLILDLDLPQGNISLDSDLNSDDENELALNLSDIVNKPFYIFLTNEGKIFKTEGLDQIITGNDLSDQSSFREFLSEQNLISSLENALNIFPENILEIGDSWKRTHKQNLSNQFDLTLDRTFTLESLSDELAWVYVESIIKGSLPANSSLKEIDIDGTQEGYIEVDRLSGLILFSEIKQSFQGVLKSSGMEIPMKISSINTLEGSIL